MNGTATRYPLPEQAMCDRCKANAAKAAQRQDERRQKLVQAMTAASGKPAAASAAGAGGAKKDAAKGPVKDKFVLALQLNAIGGSLLGGEKVVVVDPETKQDVGEPQTTDAQGRIFVEVPENKPYDLRLVPDEEVAHTEPEAPHDHDVSAQLFCRFVDPFGAPVVGQTVSISGPGGSFEVETGGDGEIEPGVDPGAYDLEIKGERFQAHTLLVRDLHHDEGEHYVFVVGDLPYDAEAFEDAIRRGEAHEQALESEQE